MWTQFSAKVCKSRYTLGDKLQQPVVATRSCDKSVHVKNFCDNLCLLNRILSQQHVAKNQIREFLRLVAATKFCCRDKDFHKNFPVHTKRFVAATCRLNVSLQLQIVVARPAHTA